MDKFTKAQRTFTLTDGRQVTSWSSYCSMCSSWHLFESATALWDMKTIEVGAVAHVMDLLPEVPKPASPRDLPYSEFFG